MNKLQGFSLIELAMVLVIAGLLLAGVMRGQELIANAKVKSLASDFRNIPAYIYGYQDRFRALPGDDHVADIHLAGGVNATSGNQAQNGLIEGAWSSDTATDESYLLWQHLRLAGFATGSAVVGSAQYVPRNSEGGRLGITNSGTLGIGSGTFNGMHALCSDGILGKYALQLDIMLDDGAGDSGAMRILNNGTQSSGAPDTGTATLQSAMPYLVCMSF